MWHLTLAMLAISGAFVHTATLRVPDLAAMPHISEDAVEHDGTTSHYDGIWLSALLGHQGAPAGNDIKGRAAASYVLVKGSDGDVALFSLAELNTKDVRCAPILAYRRNGAPIGVDLGPLRVVAPCDSTHARWVRNVVAIIVESAQVP